MPHLSGHVTEGTNLAVSVGQYFSTMLDQSMNWSDAEKLCQQWNGQFALKGIMSVEDAKRFEPKYRLARNGLGPAREGSRKQIKEKKNRGKKVFGVGRRIAKHKAKKAAASG